MSSSYLTNKHTSSNSLQKRAVITGAAGCVGGALVDALHKQGWIVHGWDRASQDDQRVVWNEVDVSILGSCEAAASELDGIDLLVNAAAIGVGGNSASDQLSPEVWDQVIGVNLSGTFHSSIALHSALAQRQGTVVNIASITGHVSGPGRAAYSTSKAAIIQLTKLLATDWANDKIRVVAVSPGYIDTPRLREALDSGRLDMSRILKRTPGGRIAKPGDIADIAVMLADPRFELVNGSTIRADGGWVANGDY